MRLLKNIAKCDEERQLVTESAQDRAAWILLVGYASRDIENRLLEYTRLLEGAKKYGFEKEVEKISLLKEAEEIALPIAQKGDGTMRHRCRMKIWAWLKKKGIDKVIAGIAFFDDSYGEILGEKKRVWAFRKGMKLLGFL
jgi:hypothetical protein